MLSSSISPQTLLRANARRVDVRHRSRLLLLSLSMLLTSCSNLQPQLTSKPLSQQQIEQDLAAAGLPSDALGLALIPLQHAGKAVYYRAEVPMAPASTMKLLTTAVALAELGPDWHGSSALYLSQQDQVRLAQGANSLVDPLYLVGAADTDLDYGALSDLLRQLYELGVRHLPAGVQLDRSLFAPERSDVKGVPFDESPRAYYNHQPDALDLAQNMQQLTVKSDQQQLSVQLQPGWDGLELDWSNVRLTDRPCAGTDFNRWQFETKQLPLSSHSAARRYQLRISGDFARGCQQQQWLAVLDRDLQLQLALQTLWRRQGTTSDPTSFSGQLRMGAKPTDAEFLLQHSGRPLRELLQRVNKQSDNALTRLLFLQLGVTETSKQSTPLSLRMPNQQLASQRIRQWLEKNQLHHSGLQLDNGAGLSRSERISPLLLAQLLQQQWQTPASLELMASLPLAAVDGTLKNRFVNQPAAGKARLKTGTLRDVTALAGFVWDAQQRPWVWVSLVNHPDAIPRGKPLLDRWVNQLASSD